MQVNIYSFTANLSLWTTDAVKKGDAKLVYIVSDLDFPEQVLHLKPLCEEKNIPYVCVPKYPKYGVVDSAPSLMLVEVVEDLRDFSKN